MIPFAQMRCYGQSARPPELRINHKVFCKDFDGFFQQIMVNELPVADGHRVVHLPVG